MRRWEDRYHWHHKKAKESEMKGYLVWWTMLKSSALREESGWSVSALESGKQKIFSYLDLIHRKNLLWPSRHPGLTVWGPQQLLLSFCKCNQKGNFLCLIWWAVWTIEPFMQIQCSSGTVSKAAKCDIGCYGYSKCSHCSSHEFSHHTNKI